MAKPTTRAPSKSGAKAPRKDNANPAPTSRTSGQTGKTDVEAARQETLKTEALKRDTADAADAITTNQGLPIGDDQNSLKAGERGPTLLEDFHLREKITHFDHERIPERVVHARGAAAHGYFEVYEDLSHLTKAQLFRDPSKQTPVFVRFSTVAGSRGSADTPRDVRGFAVKFYTDEGVWDLVGNNIPVFFIQDAIKFPDFIHAVKPEPNNEIPQAASAHDTFWDFVSLTPESAHMLMWVMSDRAFPRSFAMMEGFGVHTFRLVNEEGVSRFVKFHWKPIKGVYSLWWDEAQKVAGKDPDFNRRDMFEAIERGDFLEWELGLQIVEEEDEHKFGFDILDPTKIIPEETVPIQRIGRMVLNRNPDNFFAETEQSAFHLGHIVPGIDFSNDPLLQGRLFSYLDTQLKRVGPNFAELPINRPLCPVHNNQRDAVSRTAINTGRVSYFPSSLPGGLARQGNSAEAFESYPATVEGAKLRRRSPSFSDHFSQATMFWNSMSDWEKDHIAAAFSFELNMVETEAVRERAMNELLANISPDLAERVAAQTGIRVAPGDPQNPTPSAPTPSGPLNPQANELSSPALSMNKRAESIKGRKVAILIDDGVDETMLDVITAALEEQQALFDFIAPHAGHVTAKGGANVKINKAAPNAPSVLYDAAIVPGGTRSESLVGSKLAHEFLGEAFWHGKPLAFFGEGADLREGVHLPSGEDGVLEGEVDMTAFIDMMKQHRFHRA
jgi:catalase